MALALLATGAGPAARSPTGTGVGGAGPDPAVEAAERAAVVTPTSPSPCCWQRRRIW